MGQCAPAGVRVGSCAALGPFVVAARSRAALEEEAGSGARARLLHSWSVWFTDRDAHKGPRMEALSAAKSRLCVPLCWAAPQEHTVGVLSGLESGPEPETVCSCAGSSPERRERPPCRPWPPLSSKAALDLTAPLTAGEPGPGRTAPAARGRTRIGAAGHQQRRSPSKPFVAYCAIRIRPPVKENAGWQWARAVAWVPVPAYQTGARPRDAPPVTTPHWCAVL
jgi:hypothetical protein